MNRTCVLAVAAAGLFASSAPAATIGLGPVTLNVNWGSQQNAGTSVDFVVLENVVEDNLDGSFHLFGSAREADGAWKIAWDMTVDPDPFVFATFEVTNNVDRSEDFNVLAFLPIEPALPSPTQMYGSMSGSVLDSSGNG